MPVKTKVRIGPLNFPFFPMRPTKGVPLTAKNIESTLASLASTYIFQPKLNGDRSCLGVLDGKIYIQQRHGGWYSYGVDNKDTFLTLPSGTVLDGEVKDKKFFPFELLSLGDTSLINRPVEERVAGAETVCKMTSTPWIFAAPEMDWLKKLEANAPKWEGVVAKKKGSSYIPLASDNQASASWFKLKWVA